MRQMIAVAAAVVLASGCAATPPEIIPETPVALMSWGDLTSQPLPQPSSTHAYGEGEAQIADLWLPEGLGPHPVVLMVHGGCWQKAIADRTLMNYAAEDLRQRGLAVWNIEYRGVDEPGGGYPGTFLDVSLASQALLDQGEALGLDVENIVAVGHSAGGHLAAWLAAQPNLPADSAVNTGFSLPLSAVVISGGLADLETSAPITLDSCLANVMDNLTGKPDALRRNVFADTSPAELLPVAPVLISVNGEQDRIAPPELGRALTATVRAAGGTADYIEAPDSGHVELIAPGTQAFDLQADLLTQYLGR